MKLHTRLDRTVEQELRIRRSENAALFGGCLMVIFIILASIAIYGAMIGFIVWAIVTVLRVMGIL